MISANWVIFIHSRIIKTSGGADGLRDTNLLKSALQRPFHTFEGTDLYKSIFEKSAALIESILINHPFIDGNKRTGFVLLRIFLIENGFDFIASEEEKYGFIIGVAEGKMRFLEITSWLEKSILKIN